jgi:CheY-like chemotaxis protein
MHGNRTQKYRVRNCTNAIRNKAESSTKAARHISLRLNDFLTSLLFHRKITAVPFTSLRGYGKQRKIAVMDHVMDQTMRNSQHARGQMSKFIAIIDDAESMQDSLRDLIESTGLVARCFGSAEEFLASGLHRQAACLITDILMPKMSGLELQARLKDEECDIPIIFITAHGNARMRILAMREGAVEFLAKPFDPQVVLKTVRAAVDM